MRAILIALMVGIVASACSLGGAGASSSRRSHIVPATLLSHFRGSGIQFDYPASWSHHRHGFSTSMTGPIIDLSTQPMINPCTTTGNTTQCTLPVRRLKPGGVVVVWDTGGGFSIQSRRPDLGVRVRVIRPGCPKVGGDEAVVGSIVASHRRVFLVSACLRGPNVAANERAVRAMLASAVPVD